MASVTDGDGNLGRREALSLFGLVIAAAACGSATTHGVAASTTSRSAPSTGGVAPTGRHSTTTGTPATNIVAGRNAALNHAILSEDAKGFNGRWNGDWSIAGGARGTVAGTVTIDPDARTLTAIVDPGIAVLGQPNLPGFRVEGSVDSFVYNSNTGAFHIVQSTPVGIATLESLDGIGSGTFRLTVTNIPKHLSVQRVVATGVANRGGQIPIQFAITHANGAVQHGTATLKPVGR
jgi:hypothetical protein